MESLLGQFYTRIKGSQEDIASEGLTYVLQRSFAARQALNKIIQMDSGLVLEDINYSTQNVGEKLERPDISGIDKDGKEVVILEAKFWASLTDNQPIEYLRRLGHNSVLMFITPTLRVRPIFNEIKMRLTQAEISFVPDDTNHSFKLYNGSLIIKTWNEILQAIRLQLVQANEQNLLSDIDQVIGLCETIDNNSFQPYQSEDFAPSIAMKINSYYDIVDKAVDELKKRGLANTSGVSAAPQKYGYTRYFKMGTMGISLNVRFDLWEKIADTPFWLSVKDDTSDGRGWKQTEPFKAKIKRMTTHDSILRNLAITPYENNKRELFIPIYPLTEKTEDLVIDNIASKIEGMVVQLTK